LYFFFDPDDLPGYAGRLFDGYRAHPEVARLATWYRMERATDRAPVDAMVAANGEKVAAIEQAQQAGRLPTRFDAAELLALVLTISAMWTSHTPEMIGGAEDPIAQRRTVIEAVATLLST